MFKVHKKQIVKLLELLKMTKKNGNLATLIEKADRMRDVEIIKLGGKAKQRIINYYSWKFIADEYKNVFIKNK